ncbi:MAG: spore germination protein [Clostridia bacterium]|nr:spore germination protein [Clostridia bacterium]
MKVSKSISENLEYMKNKLSFGLSSDVILKEFTVNAGIGKKYKAFLMYFEGTTNTNQIDEYIIGSMHLMPRNAINYNLEELVENQLITRNQLTKYSELEQIIERINYGGCAIFVDTLGVAFVADVKGWNMRSLDQPVAEGIVKGPQVGFIETLRINTALVRKIVRNENLICENINVGKTGITSCNILYVKNVVNDNLVKEVRRRINKITVDYINDSGELEQLIEDFSWLPTPQILSTERPDRVASAVLQGKVAILVDGSPFALILPINAFELTHSSEDNYLRFPYANLLRIIRMIAMITSLLLPGIFIAIVNFHHEAIPLDLLFAIEATREKVPFSLTTELIVLEIAFEFIRDASVRMPSSGGNAIGIIGGLVVGQAAVEANLVSPIALIIVALTGIGSFVIPNYFLGFSFRIVKYLYIIAGALGGFLGISLAMFLQIIWLCSSQSFGIPFFAPLAPKYDSDPAGTFFVKPIWKRSGTAKVLSTKKEGIKNSRNWAKGKDKTIYQPDDTIDIS